jgi:hypothetical protein
MEDIYILILHRSLLFWEREINGGFEPKEEVGHVVSIS